MLFSLLLLLIVTPSHRTTFRSSPTSIANEVVPSGYVEHEPIRVLQDSDFEDYSFAGNGSPANPYVISNLYIRSVGPAITIRQVNARFVIRDCYFEGVRDSSSDVADWRPPLGHIPFGRGVWIDDAYGFSIENCTFVNRDVGALIYDSSDFSVSDCRMNSCTSGAGVSYSADFGISGCRGESGERFIWLQEDTYFSITGCESHAFSEGNIL